MQVRSEGGKEGRALPLAMRPDNLRLADGIVFYERTNEFERAELAAIRTGHANDLGPQGPNGRNTCCLLIQWSRGNLQGNAGRTRKVPASGKDCSSAAYVQNRRKIQKVLPFFIHSPGKNRNGEGKSLPPTSLLGTFQFRHLENFLRTY